MLIYSLGGLFLTQLAAAKNSHEKLMNGLYNLEIFDVELMLYSELPRNIQVKARFKRHSLHVGQTLSVERKRTLILFGSA